MLANMPASAVIDDAPWRSGIGGTIWNGEIGIVGGSTLRWKWAPLRSIVSLGFAADWRATGPNTDLGGGALVRPGRIILDSVSGAADASLLRAIQPDLPFTCQLAMQAEFARIALGGSAQMATGKLTTEAGSCQPARGGAPTAVAPLALTADHVGTESRLTLSPATQRLRTLATIVLGEDGTVEVNVTPAGTAALPFIGLPPGGSLKGRI